MTSCSANSLHSKTSLLGKEPFQYVYIKSGAVKSRTAPSSPTLCLLQFYFKSTMEFMAKNKTKKHTIHTQLNSDLKISCLIWHNTVKAVVYLKMKNDMSKYSCRSTPVWHSFICRTQNKIFKTVFAHTF